MKAREVHCEQEDLKDGPCIASEVQLTAAFERMVKPQDNGDNFKEKVVFVSSTPRNELASRENPWSR